MLRQLVARKLPRLASHLSNCHIDVEALVAGWFNTLFFSVLPPEVRGPTTGQQTVVFKGGFKSSTACAAL